MAYDFLDAVRMRRSFYSITNEECVERNIVEGILRDAVLHTPTSFNAQGGRAILLFDAHHQRLWDIVLKVLGEIVPEHSFHETEKKVAGFSAGVGTIMFFEDQDVLTGLQRQYPLYADAFPGYSLQSSAMMQYICWAGIEAAGYGASLQHYNPLIDNAVHEAWDIPPSWKLVSQLVFGYPAAPPAPKHFQPIEDRMLIFSGAACNTNKEKHS